MHLVPVPPGAVASVWPHVSAWLRQACDRPGCDVTIDDLQRLCIEQQAQLIVIRDDDAGRYVAAGVTQVRDHESGTRSCWVLAVGGTGARAWRGTLERIEAGARRSGCNRIEFVGRPGWTALLPGYAVEAHFSKDLTA